MNDISTKRIAWPIIALAAVTLVAAGSTATYLLMRRAQPPESTAAPSRPGTGPMSPPGPVPSDDVAIALSTEAVARAEIEVATVGRGVASSRLRLPAVVQPNAYRSVVVTPIAGGRVTRVPAELGQHVRRGQTLAEVYSPELAEAQSRYLAAHAEFDAHQRELERTQKLAEIGSASRRELEKIHAEHTAEQTMLASLGTRLTLLGMTSAEVVKLASGSVVSAATRIAAPIDGVVTARQANVGLNVEPTTQLFTVVDLSTVWLVGDLYERDFSRVRVGSRAMVTTTAYPDVQLEGKVSYIDPELSAETRTAKIRVEVPNRGSDLRLGMYAELHISGGGASEQVVVPRSAVQMVGDRAVVYIADPTEQGRFVEREVRLGEAQGEVVEVLSGVQPGEAIVSKGSFAIRAEIERRGLRAAPAAAVPRPGSTRQPSEVQSVRVTVSEKGFDPPRVSVRAGAPARVTFVRTDDKTCATEIAVPSLGITSELPLNQPVDVEFTPQRTGEIEFVCGMNMLRGTIVVQ
jgi:RND family efflux transporter MFP subunit